MNWISGRVWGWIHWYLSAFWLSFWKMMVPEADTNRPQIKIIRVVAILATRVSILGSWTKSWVAKLTPMRTMVRVMAGSKRSSTLSSKSEEDFRARRYSKGSTKIRRTRARARAAAKMSPTRQFWFCRWRSSQLLICSTIMIPPEY